MSPESLRIHHIMPYSRANGPGLRTVIWVQGCTLACPGCFNPLTHPSDAGEIWTVKCLVESLLAREKRIEGITISGGEPLQQPQPLLSLLSSVRRLSMLSIVLFTGYSWYEIQRFPYARRLLSLVDVLISGRYIARLHNAHGMPGSANQQIHFLSPRYTLRDLQTIAQAEILLTSSGDIILSGVDPLH